jgi:hypothetical protein
MTDPTGNPSPFGPVFISYRFSDGRDFARQAAWALRAAGAPVWHDVADMPPGDTTRSLGEALANGLSGAVLLITPEIRSSKVVRETELPRLLELAKEPDFTFAVASSIEKSPGQLDFKAPDRLLRQKAGTLAGFHQWSLVRGGDLAELARKVVHRRMEAFARLGEEEIVIDLQTRFAAMAEYSGSSLVVRTAPPDPGCRAPSPAVWEPYSSFLASLPQLLRASGAKKVRVHGGAHPSVAFALGVTLPQTCPWPDLIVEDQRQELWRAPPGGQQPLADLSSIPEDLGNPGQPVAVLVDLLPAPHAVDSFGEYLQNPNQFYAGSLRISLQEKRLILPSEAGSTVLALAERIRRFAGEHGTNAIHLFLRAPFAIPVLLGRELNTYEITLHEWEDGKGRPHYLPAATVASGRGGGPVVAIHS